MPRYTEMKCEACRADAPRVTVAELDHFLAEHPEWEHGEPAGVPEIRRVFAFRNFVEALAFTNRVGALAEAENHHPALLTEWGRVTVRWWTHKIGGLHQNDLIAAAKTDSLCEKI